MRAEDLLARLPREPHLHAKRLLAIQALELLESGGDDPLMRDRHALELPDRPSLLSHDAPPPARDPFIEIGPGRHPLNDALIEAEVAAATYAERPDVELARFAAARMEATLDLEEGWGDGPVDVSRYSRLMQMPAGDRVEELLGERGGRDEDPAV